MLCICRMTADEFYFCHFFILISTMQNRARTNGSMCVMKKRRTNEMYQTLLLSLVPALIGFLIFFLPFWCRVFYSGHTLSLVFYSISLSFYFQYWCAHQHGNRNVILAGVCYCCRSFSIPFTVSLSVSFQKRLE